MNIWHDIKPSRITPDSFIACIEISKGSKKKYELDKDTGMIILDRILFTSTHYPANYGFIPRTYADDNDPLDVLVLCQEDIEPLSLVLCYPIGVMKMIDSDEIDEKIIAIPFGDPSLTQYKNIHELPGHLLTEMGHFFEVYKSLEGKKTYILDVEGPESAKAIIAGSIETYNSKFNTQKNEESK
jgi:inorganic pyrophosphatase